MVKLICVYLIIEIFRYINFIKLKNKLKKKNK